ncbi:MAG: cysteine synthase family protein [Candidatus Bathyarchaeota archaeon]|nr:MAG: cysteine synthase family protein [Candidatus Bathyarchaeota archaeon]
MYVAKSILELIGKTPMVKLSNLTKDIDANVLVKLEYLNPSGSLKDRIALEMIEQAEGEGVLQPGFTIVEASTGNTGISFSFVGTLKGYRVVIYETIPGRMGEEKIKIMKNYGADVKVITPKELEHERSVAGAEIELPGRKMCLELERRNPKVWWARQFSNPHNVRAHNKTAREILTQTKGRVDAFVASIGTGGTLMGIAEVLKKELPHIKIIGIQPASSKVTMVPGKPYPKSEIKGGIISDMLEKPNLIDEIVRVSDTEAVKMTHRLRVEEGLYAGVSSGANVLIAVKEAQRLGDGKNVVTVLPDSGDRYLTEEHYVT